MARTQYSKKSKPTDPMQVETSNADVHTFTLKIWVYLRSAVQPFRFLNPNSIVIATHMGCYKEKLTMFWDLKPSASSLPHFFGFENSVLEVVFPRTMLQQVHTIQLNQVFELQFDFAKCGPEKVTAYSDSIHTALVSQSEPVNLSPNPTSKQVPEEISPVLKVTTNAISSNNQMHLVAETGAHKDNFSPVVKKSISVSVSICNDQPQPLNSTFNISIAQGGGSFSMNVSSLFTQIAYKFPAQCKNESFILSSTNQPTPDSLSNIELLGT